MEKAKVGDTIEWTFEDDSIFQALKGKTFRAKVAVITDEDYGVYAEYGQDYIPFEEAKIIKQKEVMDAKNKAQELIDKYAVNVDVFCNIEDENYIPNGLLTNKSSVKLALIAVNEILEAQPSYRYWDTHDDETPSAITFWNEVKDELNKHLEK